MTIRELLNNGTLRGEDVQAIARALFGEGAAANQAASDALAASSGQSLRVTVPPFDALPQPVREQILTILADAPIEPA